MQRKGVATKTHLQIAFLLLLLLLHTLIEKKQSLKALAIFALPFVALVRRIISQQALDLLHLQNWLQKARLDIDCWTLQVDTTLALHTDHKICSNLCVSSKLFLVCVCVFFSHPLFLAQIFPFVSLQDLCSNFCCCCCGLWFAVVIFFCFFGCCCGLWVVFSFLFPLLLEGILEWCWCCSGLQLLV